jgi:DNA-binding winged helix-turn-helix (wHTH) protein/tetratricopeptide (TPR) repeat protein/TolB-like protein
MYESTQDAIWVHSIDLAQEADFDLGPLRVRPARCEVEWNGVSQALQRRVMQVLVVLARARGSVVSQVELVNRCWRGLSVSDDAIYRCISKLRKLAADYPDAPYAIEAIPGVGYRLTSSGLVEDGPAARFAALPGRRFRPGALVVGAAFFASVIVGAAFWMFNGEVPDQHSLRVAVQPFELLGDSGGARSLARRIPNEVVDALGDSQIETILVGEQTDKGATGAAGMSPGLIVTGILRDDGRSTIVDVRIEDGSTRAALWSTEFKRDNREASDLPLEVAARVADVVNMTSFARSANPPLTDDSALTALLQTTDMIRDAHDGAWAPMVESAQGVVAHHPDFAFGHSVLAAAYAEAADSINVPNRAQAMSEAARREANLTLKLDPQDAGAYAVLSGLVPRSDYRDREAILLRGIRFARHPKEPVGALYSYEGVLLESVGRLREALSFQLTAQATDKWGAPKAAKVALIYAKMGKLPEARAWIQKAVQRWPNHSGVRSYRFYIAGLYEQPADGLAMINGINAQNSADDSRTAIWRTFVKARMERSAEASAATIPKIREAADKGQISRETEIIMLAELGDAKEAIKAANLALDHHEQLEPRFFLFTPVTRNIQQDPGFVALAARMGLIKYWRETGTRPDFCTDRAARGECSPQLLAALK